MSTDISPLRQVRHRLGAAVWAARHWAPVPEPEPEPEPDPLAESLRFSLQRDVTDFQSMRSLLAFTLAPDDSCIDIGCHKGAVLAEMMRIAPEGRHLAFEPIPGLAEFLREHFPTVAVHEMALSDTAGRTEFIHVRGDAEGWSGLKYRPLPGGAEPDHERLDIAVGVLDDVLESEHPDLVPRVIKIDVEGAELQVLRGARRTLERHHPTLIFEHGTGSAEVFGTVPELLFALLSELGYRVFDMDGNGPYTLEALDHSFRHGERVNWVAHP